MHRTVSMKAKSQSRIVRIVAIAWAFFLISPTLTINSFAADVPILIQLEYRNQDGEHIRTEIEAKPGLIASPLENRTQTKWAIRSGEAIKSNHRPGDRIVNFYKGAGLHGILLCTINVRYFRDSSGQWIPRYQLNQQPLVRWDGGRWKPVFEVRGVPNLVVLTGSSLPNAEGFYPSLEFGMTSSRTTIDSWNVK